MPPVAFWFHWGWLVDPNDAADSAYQKHMHELCRNIWIAFVAVLVVVLDLPRF